jgi:branched-chain amino acid transport system ATP-binding protein
MREARLADLAPDLLRVEDFSAGYGEAIVLSRISFSLPEGGSLALLGRNGTGKTTLINSIVGLTRRRAGTIQIGGRDVTGLKPNQRAHAGIGWVPQERNIFRSLTVEENLTAVMRQGKWTLERVWKMFPRLEERRRNMGNQLSGGEQQMLAMARALVLDPRLLLLDEPLEGLAPIIVEELLRLIQTLIRDEGVTVILVEQSATKILPLTQRALVLERGMIAYEGESRELLADPEMMASLLGVAERKPARH